ncbi:MAG: DinB family protein, partial [Paludibaculum sp.]
MARTQLLALAEAAPESIYAWSPVPGARAFSAVLIHIAVANFCLLHLAGVRTPTGVELYGELSPDEPEQRLAMVRKNLAMERAIAGKPAVIEFLRRSLEAVEHALQDSSPEALEEITSFIGMESTRRRLYLRMLVHTHEHMGQTIA